MSRNIGGAEIGDQEWVTEFESSNHHHETESRPSSIRSSSANYFLQKQYYTQTQGQIMRSYGGGGVSEIHEAEEEEEEEEQSNREPLFEINSSSGLPLRLDTIREEVDAEAGSLFSFDFHNGSVEDAHVYVAVGKSSEESSSMDALLWTLNNAVNPSSTVVFLVHVFPEIKFIPTPLGMIPASQVNQKQKENYMVQERSKRRDFIDKFLNVCSASKVNADTILIESDMEAKAILDLIPILNIRTLVLGTTKANLRRMRTRRGTRIANQIKKGAPEFCEVKIICEGKEIMDFISDSPCPRYSDSPFLNTTPQSTDQNQDRQSNDDSFACVCFVKPNVFS